MSNTIPQIIHQIWIGPKKRPDLWMNTVREFAKEYGYEYRLWDDTAVAALTMTNRAWYDKEPTWNGKSDILRYELLYQYGGVYIDADMVILKPALLHNLIQRCKTDIGIGFEIDGKLLTGSVLFAQKSSYFIRHCIEELPRRDMSRMAWISVGPKLITDIYVKLCNELPITLYKSTIFYPIRWHGIQDIELHKKIDIPPESVMFQYGYSTNNLEDKLNAE